MAASTAKPPSKPVQPRKGVSWFADCFNSIPKKRLEVNTKKKKTEKKNEKFMEVFTNFRILKYNDVKQKNE